MNEVVEEKRNNKSLIIIISIIAILLIGSFGFFIWKSNNDDTKTVEKKETKEDKKVEDKKDTDITDNDNTITSTTVTEWGKKYYSYIKSNLNNDYSVEGYFVDLLNDKTPELVIYIDNDEDVTMNAVLYIDNGVVKKSKEYEDGYLALLYNLKKDSFDSWYIVSLDDDSNDLYSHPTDIIAGKISSLSIVVKTEDDIENFNNSYIEIPLDLDRHDLSASGFDENELLEMINEYESYDPYGKDMIEFVESVKDNSNI